MLFRRASSRARYREYLERRRTDRDYAQRSHDAASPDKNRRHRSFLALLRRFLGLLEGHRGTTAAALATLSFVTLISLTIPASTKIAIDYVLTDHPGPSGIPAWARDAFALPTERTTLLWSLGLAMVALAIIGVTMGSWGRFQMTRLTKRVQVRLRRLAFEHAVRLPLHRIQHFKSGGMASLLREDASQAGDLLFSMIYNPWRAIVQLLGTLVILATVDWRMLAGAVALLPVTWISHRTWIGRIRPVYRDMKLLRMGIDAATTEAFGGMRVVRGFGQHRAESNRFVRSQGLLARQEMLTWWWSRIIEIAWSVLIPLASAGVLVYGGTQVIKGRLTIGDVMMFSTYLIMLLGPLDTLTSTAANIQGNLAGLDRVLDLLEEPLEFAGVTPPAQVVEADKRTAQGRIRLKDVWFAYPKPAPDASKRTPAEGAPPAREPEPVIRGVSLGIEAGETVALVGASGSGKTTLCNLIARFFDPTSGVVEFDGTDLRSIEVNSFRRLLGIVEQDVFLFDGTVAENIAYGRRDAARGEIEGAARAANAHEFILKFDNGYDTLIGERGVRLSGGQRQRIAIARALLADPVVLILDEATSNLDAESEAMIQRSLATLMQGRTCVVIAHRLSTVRNADRIVVMGDGRVLEIGKHEQLLAAGGRYADLLRTQIEAHAGVGPKGEAGSPLGAAIP